MSPAQETGTGGGECTFHSMTITLKVEYWGECSNGRWQSWTQEFFYNYYLMEGDCEGLTEDDFNPNFGGGEQTVNDGDEYTSWNDETQEVTVNPPSQIIGGTLCRPKPFRIKEKGDPWAVYNGEESKFNLG